MKKSVMLIIGLICLVGVIIVAFFGVQPQNISPVVYIETVEILDMSGNKIKTQEDGQKVLNLEFNPDLYDQNTDTYYMQYFFNVEINENDPKKVPTNESVLFSTDAANLVSIPKEPVGAARKGAFLIQEKKGVITQDNRYFICSISCKANDGSPTNPVDKITLLITYPLTSIN